MELKISIDTPAGYADPNNKKIKFLRKLLFSKGKILKEIVSEKKDNIIYILDVDFRTALEINKRISFFYTLTKQMFKNKLAVKALKKMADTPEDYEEVKRLITDGTKINILKS